MTMTAYLIGKPKRIRLSRAKGWRMPAGALKVDRSTKWGNPWTVRHVRGGSWNVFSPDGRVLFHFPNRRPALEMAVASFRELCLDRLVSVTDSQVWNLDELRGKDLACWCEPDDPCHADVLLELANT